MCLLGVLEYPGKDTVVVVCVCDPTASGVHPVGCGPWTVGCVGSQEPPYVDVCLRLLRAIFLMIVKSFVAILIDDGAQV